MRKLDDFVPKSHLLCSIRVMANEATGEAGSAVCGMFEAGIKGGRPSIAPPEKLPRAMLIQVLCGIRSERQLTKQVQYNLFAVLREGIDVKYPFSERNRGDVARTVVSQPFDFRWRLHYVVKALLDSRQHDVTYHIAAMTTGRRHPIHRFTIAAVQCERHAQWPAVITTKLEAIGAPALIAFRHGHLTVTSALRTRSRRPALQK